MTSPWLARTRLLTFLFSTSMLAACGGGESAPGASPDSDNDGGDVIARSTMSLVATPMDDVEEQSDGSISTTSSDLELINDGGAQTVGIRFVVSVPQNATITNAYVQFTVDEITIAETSLQINGEASADAAAFAGTSNNVSARPATSASVPWNPPAWTTVGDATVAQRTPDLSVLVQEIVDLNGWEQNNHIVLMITGTGSRTAVSRDNSSTQAPTLYVEYEIAGGSSNNGNNIPRISGNPASNVVPGSAYLFAPVAVDSDMDDILLFSINNLPDWASFNIKTGVLSGTPSVNDTGMTDNIVISVNDGTDTASLAAFSITVTSDAPSTPPIAVDDNVIGTEDSVSIIAVLANDTDADGDTLGILSITQPANGDASISGTNITYSPNANYFGTDTFTYTADDGSGGTDTATVTIVVNPVNDTPVAQPDSASATQGNAVIIALLDNDTGLGDGSIAVSITSSTTSGTLINNNDGTVSYTPGAGFTGTDSFIYQIADTDGQTSTANGSITVTCDSGCPGNNPRTVRLTWDASPSADVVGYYVYYGTTPGNYTGAVWVASGTSYNYTTSLLGMQYFAITAQTSDGNESGYSIEVSVNI